MGWTDERVELLKKLWADGLSASQIRGPKLGGITRNAVIGKVHRLGSPAAPRARPRRRTTAQGAFVRAHHAGCSGRRCGAIPRSPTTMRSRPSRN